MSLPAYEGLRLAHDAASPAGSTATPEPHPATPHTSPRSVVLRLAGAERGCGQARDFVRRTLTGWELDHCGPDALTVVTELLANAVLHATAHRPNPGPARGSAPDDAEIWLRLSLRRHAHLVCAVTDPSDHPPVYPHTSDPFSEHGRGLRIIDALSEHWGWTRRHPMGKTVWAMLPTADRV